jgi:hypothetical protein
MAEAKARHPDWPDLFFNVGFAIDPDGDIVLQHYKLSALLPYERRGMVLFASALLPQKFEGPSHLCLSP